MPLVSSPALTPKKLTVNRANAQLSRGPITLDGLIRVRDARIKHGANLLKANGPYFRHSAVAKSKPESEVLLRRENSSFRQVGADRPSH